MPETWFAIELATLDGDIFYAMCKSAEELTNYVRANSGEMASMKVSAVDPSSLAQSRVLETFGVE